MSNAVMHKLQQLISKYTALCPEADRQMHQTTRERVRQFTDLTEKQASATRWQGYTGLGGAALGLVGTVGATAFQTWMESPNNYSKQVGTACSQLGNVFSSGYEAEKTRLGGRAGLIQNHFLPEGKQTLEKSHQFIQGLMSSLSRLQEQSGRSFVAH